MKNTKKTLYIDEGLHRRIKIEAARRGITLHAIVEAAIRLYLSQKSGEDE